MTSSQTDTYLTYAAVAAIESGRTQELAELTVRRGPGLVTLTLPDDLIAHLIHATGHQDCRSCYQLHEILTYILQMDSNP